MKYYGTKNGKDYGFYLEPFEGGVEITDEYWIELIEGQAEGRIIETDENGHPISVEYNPTDEELAKIARRKRDWMLEQSDWTQLADTNLPAESIAAYREYRQQLRDLPKQPNFPRKVVFPEIYTVTKTTDAKNQTEEK